jgi:hypothetical protein
MRELHVHDTCILTLHVIEQNMFLMIFQMFSFDPFQMIIYIFSNLHIFPFDLNQWYCQYPQTDSDTENHRSV